nr:uncharacterized protein LOC125418630 [Ziziphus jujuba var. spinosa]
MTGERFYHPGHDHSLRLVFGTNTGIEYADIDYADQERDKKCHGCGRCIPFSDSHYYCPENGCEYYLDRSCFMLGYHSEINHPLHPQHPLIPYFKSFPYNDQAQFICSFCTKAITSGFLLHCTHCDFYLDRACSQSFEDNLENLSNYEFRHFFHCHENHTLLPHIFPDNFYEYLVTCQGCGHPIWGAELLFKCPRSFECKYYLHVPCSRVPKKMKHPFHPQHTLTLLERPPDDIKQGLHCVACRKIIQDAFVLHCTECSFNLDIGCAFRKPTMKSEYHEHPLACFDTLYRKDDLCAIDSYWGFRDRCAVCNASCTCIGKVYRCVDCNFNVHEACLSLPLNADYEDHVHPFTLITSLNEDEDGKYYCDLCEDRREPNHGLYCCVECGPSFVAHFECVLPPDEAETPILALTADEKQLVSKLDMKLEKMGEMLKQLLRERPWENVTEKLDKLEKSNAEAEAKVVTSCLSALLDQWSLINV